MKVFWKQGEGCPFFHFEHMPPERSVHGPERKWETEIERETRKMSEWPSAVGSWRGYQPRGDMWVLAKSLSDSMGTHTNTDALLVDTRAHTHMPSTLHISNQTTSELRAVQYVASRSDITPKVKCHLHISTVSIQQLQYQHDMVSAPIHTTLHLVVRATLGEGGWRREEASSEKRDASSCWSPC